jgi:hypothetical protein
MHEMEAQPVLVDGGVEPHRHVDEAEPDRAGPERPRRALAWHGLGIAASRAGETQLSNLAR